MIDHKVEIGCPRCHLVTPINRPKCIHCGYMLTEVKRAYAIVSAFVYTGGLGCVIVLNYHLWMIATQ